MLALYINEYRIKRQNKRTILHYEDKQIINPKDEDFIRCGYLELIEGEIPEYDVETQYITERFEVRNNKIYQNYIVNEIPEEETTEE